MTVWDDLIGQREAIATLQSAASAAVDIAAGRSVVSGAMTHAWLFTGPAGSGRSVAARAFAAALQCERGGCGSCDSCHQVSVGSHPDVRVIRTEKLSIGVDEVRDLVRRSALTPAGRRWRSTRTGCRP